MEHLTRGNILDLGSLKGIDPEKQEQAARQELLRNGFICTCGERVAEQGIQLFGVWKGLAPTGASTYQNTAMLCTQIFCSLRCPHALRVLEEGIPFEAKVSTGTITGHAPIVASKPSVVNWFDRNPPGV